jgi:F-box-like
MSTPIPEGHITTLPNDHLIAIFEKLPMLENFLSISCVCQKWKEFSENNIFWRPVARSLRKNCEGSEPFFQQIKVDVKLKLSQLKEADQFVDIKEIKASEFDSRFYNCYFNLSMSKNEKDAHIINIQNAALDKIERCHKVEVGFYACLFLSRIKISTLGRAAHYASQLAEKTGSSKHFVVLVREAIQQGFLDEARQWMLQIKKNDNLELSRARLAFVKEYSQTGKIDECIKEIQLMDDKDQKHQAIELTLAYIPEENYPLREKMILLDTDPYLSLFHLVNELISHNKKELARAIFVRNFEILNHPPEIFLDTQVQMDVWFGRAPEAFERIKKLDMTQKKNQMQLLIFREELNRTDPHSTLMPEVLERVHQLV